jgi:phosphomannomutase
MIAQEKKPVKDLLKRLYKDVGTIMNHRVNIHLTDSNQKQIADRLANPLSELGGLRVKGKKTTADGTKYMLEDDSWVLMRASGTEPVVRVYVEAESESKINTLIEAGKKFVLG